MSFLVCKYALEQKFDFFVGGFLYRFIDAFNQFFFCVDVPLYNFVYFF